MLTYASLPDGECPVAGEAQRRISVNLVRILGLTIPNRQAILIVGEDLKYGLDLGGASFCR